MVSKAPYVHWSVGLYKLTREYWFVARCLGRIATDKGNRSNTPAAPEGPQSVPKAFDWYVKI